MPGRRLTTIRLSRYPATKAKYQRTPQHFTRDARSIMGRNGYARKHLDMIAPLPRRALCCGCALHNRAGHVASSRGPRERTPPSRSGPPQRTPRSPVAYHLSAGLFTARPPRFRTCV